MKYRQTSFHRLMRVRSALVVYKCLLFPTHCNDIPRYIYGIREYRVRRQSNTCSHNIMYLYTLHICALVTTGTLQDTFVRGT